MVSNGEMTFIEEEIRVSVACIWCGTGTDKARVKCRVISERVRLT